MTTEQRSRITGPGLPDLAVDGLLALLVGAVVMVSSGRLETFAPFPDVLLLCSVAALLVRRMWPRMVLALVTAAAAAYAGIGYPTLAIIAAPSLAMYAVAQRVSWLRALAAGGLSFLVVLPPFLLRSVHQRGLQVWGAVPIVGTALLLPTVLAVAIRMRRASVARAGAEAVRGRVEDERLQIAREVHDAIGHALAVIYMQAGVALHVSERRPEQAKQALEAVNQVSAEALVELDTTFGVFREEFGADRVDLSFDRLDGLLAAVRRVGLDVEFAVAGARRSLPAEVELAAYRIIQESLTNVLHHAGPVRATVEVRYEPAELVLSIANDEPDGSADAGEVAGPDGKGATGGSVSGNGGHGIAGMRERAAALGGTLAAGPRAAGGFQVMARLPLVKICA
ncbi:sensor histidine kinase [Actinoallomurus bryophytorum]|uniref:histidine kinase n=1 Tax=Actinoallomurus bryophytorum TaxID=1490222 RepID=A0A543CUV6_9ACTN|nr:histidine kinase [Actinoallomurus bryophytorum]TQM00829.1 signal transduction histidine kinase [Actinoallomurus bryophytorum]